MHEWAPWSVRGQAGRAASRRSGLGAWRTYSCDRPAARQDSRRCIIDATTGLASVMQLARAHCAGGPTSIGFAALSPLLRAGSDSACRTGVDSDYRRKQLPGQVGALRVLPCRAIRLRTGGSCCGAAALTGGPAASQSQQTTPPDAGRHQGDHTSLAWSGAWSGAWRAWRPQSWSRMQERPLALRSRWDWPPRWQRLRRQWSRRWSSGWAAGWAAGRHGVAAAGSRAAWRSRPAPGVCGRWGYATMRCYLPVVTQWVVTLAPPHSNAGRRTDARRIQPR
jgi:hypothetical protein